MNHDHDGSWIESIQGCFLDLVDAVIMIRRDLELVT